MNRGYNDNDMDYQGTSSGNYGRSQNYGNKAGYYEDEDDFSESTGNSYDPDYDDRSFRRRSSGNY